MSIKLSKVSRSLVLEIDGGENISVEVYKLVPALSERLAEKQRIIFEIQKEIADIEKKELDEMSKIEIYNKFVAKIHSTYIDMFKICIVDYSIVEKAIDDLPYTSIDTFNAILTEINNEMVKTSNVGIEKKNYIDV